MKPLFTLAVLISCTMVWGTSLGQQSIFYDALFIRKNCVDEQSKFKNKVDLYEVLKKYYPGALSEAELKRNPFFEPLVPVAIQQSVPTPTFQEVFSKAGNMNVTNLADGLAKFLVKRAKQELTSTFFQKFNDELEAQKDFQKIFPTTYLILKTAGTEIYNYQTYLPSLREAFEHDLDNFFLNAYDWTKSTNGVLIQELLKNKKLFTGLKASFFAGKELGRGVHPGEVINSLVALNKVNALSTEDAVDFSLIDQNLYPSLKTANLFSQSLRSNDVQSYWITQTDFNSFNDGVFARIFFGLVYQKTLLDPITFTKAGGTIELSKILFDAATKINDLQLLVLSLKNEIALIEKTINVISNSQVKNGADLFMVANSLTEIVNTMSNNKLISTQVSLDKLFEQASFYSKHFSMAWSYFEAKSYNSAVFEAYVIFNEAFPANASTKTFLKYGTFMATVASAKNSDEVEQAIESIVLPPGSASVKRKTLTNISLNAYVGVSPGYELNANESFSNGHFVFAVSAPIGVAFSKGIYKASETDPKKREKGSRSLFLALIDLGAVTAYRLDDKNSAALPDLTLSNIFAPGLYYVRGLANSPVSLGFGGQLGPQLRKIEGATAEINNSLKYSFKIFVAIDIPLLNFKTQPRN